MSRRETWLWLIALLAVSLAASGIDVSSASAFARSFESLNYFLIFAVAIAFRCALISDGSVRAARTDLAIVAAFGAAMLAFALLRQTLAIGLALSVAASLLLFREARQERALRSSELQSAGRILLVVSLSIFWCKLAILALGPLLVLLDAAGVSVLIRLFWTDISQTGALLTSPTGHSILLGGGCSVFASVSPGVMFAASAFLATKPWITKTEWAALAGLFVSLLIINALRLVLMATSYERYDYWHNGGGVPILALVQTAAVLVFTALPFLQRRPVASVAA